MPLDPKDLLTTLGKQTVESHAPVLNPLLTQMGKLPSLIDLNYFVSAALMGYHGKPISNYLQKSFDSKKILGLLKSIANKINNSDLNTAIKTAETEANNKKIGETSDQLNTKLIEVFDKKKVASLNRNITKNARPTFRGFGSQAVKNTKEYLSELASRIGKSLTKKYLEEKKVNTPFVMFPNIINKNLNLLPNKVRIEEFTIGEYLNLFKFCIIFLNNAIELVKSYNVTSKYLMPEAKESFSEREESKENLFPYAITKIVFQPNTINLSDLSKIANLISIELEKGLKRNDIKLLKNKDSEILIAISEKIIAENMTDDQEAKIYFKNFINQFFENVNSVFASGNQITINSDIRSEFNRGVFQTKDNIWVNPTYQDAKNTTLKIESNLNKNKIVKEGYSTAQSYYTTKSPDGDDVDFSITDLVLGGGYLNHKGKKFKPKGWKPKSSYNDKKSK